MKVEEWLGESNTLGIDIWNKKYRYNNESFDEWLDRVSGGDKHIRELIVQKKFLFGGRILSNRGCIDKINNKSTLSNCYVLPPVEDNIESIFDRGKELGRTYSYGGGVGMDISKLSPKGAKVRNSAKETSGAVSFMELYSLITGLIAQRGRRGALMISMDVNHPDIEEFITIKSDPKKVTKANISVKITDKFMEAVEKDEMFELYFKREETGEEIKREVNARALFVLICTQAWDNAEPGVLFWDRSCKYNLMQYNTEFELAGVNPCAEEGLPGYGCCLLGSLNLAAFVKDKKFMFEDFRRAVFEAIHALNMVLDEGLEFHPLKKQADSAEYWRPIGLGIMGLADMLIKMEIIYGSQESLDLCDEIGKVLAMSAISQSIEEAETFTDFDGCDRYAIIQSDFFKKHVHPTDGIKVLESGIRNCQLLTAPPTGSIATMLGISTGIEPIYDKFYDRKTETLNNEEKHYKIYTQIVWDYMQDHGLKEGEEDKLPEYFVTAKEIDYRDRVDMQAMWQSHIDVSISSTVNLPNSATIEDVMDLYMRAWKEGCKGITIFREGCKRAPILNSDTKKEKKPMSLIDYEIYAPPVKEEMERLTNQWMTGIKDINPRCMNKEEMPEKTGSHTGEFMKNMLEKTLRNEGLDPSEFNGVFKNWNRKDQIKRIEKEWKEYCDRTTEDTVNIRDMVEQLKVWNNEIIAGGYPRAVPTEEGGSPSDLKKMLSMWKNDVKDTDNHFFQKSIIVKTNPDGSPIDKKDAKEYNMLERGEVIKAPANSIGKNRDLITGCGSLHFQAFFDMTTGDVVMTYLSKGSTGGCNSFMVGLSRMISMAGRAGINVYEIADQLHSVPACPSYVARKHDKKDTSKGTCCPVAIGYALIEMYEEVQEEIELGGVYKGSPLYYKLKEEKFMKEIVTDALPRVEWDDLERIKKDAHEYAKELENEDNLIPTRTSKLADTLLAIPGVGEVFANMSDEDLKKAFDSIYKATYEPLKMTCSECGKCNETSEEEEEPEIGPVPKEVMELAIKDLAEKQDAEIIDQFKDIYANDTGLCPECGNPLTFEGGCNTCKCCGWSKCD